MPTDRQTEANNTTVVWTDRQTDGRYQAHYLPALCSIINIVRPKVQTFTYDIPRNVSLPPTDCIVLYCIVLYCIVLYCIVLYCIVLYCIVLYCIQGLHQWLEDGTKKYGDIWGYMEGPRPTIVLSDAEMLKQVYIKEFSKIHSRKVLM